jgi:thiamine biosynthesis protein ThiS
MSASEIQVQVNGEPHRLPVGTTLRQLLDQLAAPSTGVAVERNRQLVKKADHERTVLLDGDRLEVVTLVGGG